MEAEWLRIGVRVPGGIFSRQVAEPGQGWPGTVDLSLNLPPPAFLDRVPGSTMAQGV